MLALQIIAALYVLGAAVTFTVMWCGYAWIIKSGDPELQDRLHRSQQHVSGGLAFLAVLGALIWPYTAFQFVMQYRASDDGQDRR